METITKEIYNKYPKVFEKIETYIKSIVIDDYCPEYIYEVDQGDIICIYDTAKINYFIVPFNALYGLLKDFFKTYNIKIVNCYRCDEEKYYPEIYNGNYPDYIEFENVFEDENDCEYFSILKASEILNKME